MHTRYRLYGFWVFALCLHLCFWLYQIQHKRYYLTDSEEYIWAAKNIVYHQELYCDEFREPLRQDFFTKRPPGYPLFLTITYLPVDHPIFLLGIQNLMSLLNLVLAGSLLNLFLRESSQVNQKGHPLQRRLLPLVWGILLLAYPAQLIYANLVMTEMLFQSLILVICYALIKAWKNPIPQWLGIYTGGIILALLTKPVMYLIALPHLMGLGIWAWKKKKASMTLWAVLPLLVVGLYSGWNQQRTGYQHFSSIQSLSLFNYTTRTLLNRTQGSEAADRWIDSVIVAMEQQPTYAQQQQLIASASQEVILNAPMDYAILHLKGMVNFFLDPGRFDLYHFFGWEAPEKGLLAGFSEEGYTGIFEFFRRQPAGIVALLLIILALNALKVVALGVFVTRRELPLALRLIPLALIVYLALLTGTSGASRFAVPIFPLMWVVSGYVVIIFWEKGNQP